MLQSSSKGNSNMFVHSTNNGGPNDFNAFYYSIPNGISNTTDNFQFFDGNATLQTATVIIPAAVPGAPTIGAATAGNQQATVAFTAPASDGGSAILDYTVTSSPGSITSTGALSPLTVTGLTNGTEYTFTVRARNINGSGAASSASAPVTPQAPQTLTFLNPGPQTFGIPPTLTASSTSGLAPIFTSISTSICTITSGGTLSFLTAGSCTIHADQAGDTAYLAAPTVEQTFTINAVPPSAPANPVGIAGNAKADVSFTAPASDGGSAITAYTVTSNPGGITGTGTASPVAVNGLANGTAYTFTVTATNSAGTGSASAASAAVIPKAPQTITFNNPGAQSFGTAPTLTATSTSLLAPTFSSITPGICGITPGGTLTFLATGSCAINADQAGNAAYLAAPTVGQNFVVNAVAPGAPTHPVATAGSGQASVAFTAPGSDGGSPITSYTVTANPGGATGTGASSPIVLMGLTNGTAYTFTVTAKNAAGTGPASAASAAVTPKATQTITFNNPGAQTFGTSPALTATSTSGLVPTFTTGTASVCLITPGGTLTFVTPGSCKINADEGGNGTYLPATTVQQTFAVNAAVPGAPTAVVGTAAGGQVSVAFAEPVFTGGSPILDYTATASPGGAAATATTGPITVTGLTNGTAYTFTVTARNTAGSGPASIASAAVTPRASQTITFANPGAQAFGTTPTLTATSTSGLTPVFTSISTGICTITSGGALAFVAAGNCTINADQPGDSAYSAAATVSRTFAVNAVVPGAPTDAAGTAGNGQVSVAFAAPAFDGGSSITGYTVTASPGGATASGPGSPLVVTGLTNGTAYTFTVAARNAVGNSAASAPSAAAIPRLLTVSTPVSGMAGTGSATLSGGGPSCTLSPASGFGAVTHPAADKPMPYGEYAFESTSCTGTVTMAITYPEALPTGVQFWKFGPATVAVGGVVAASRWFPLSGVTLSADRKTVTYSITDNGAGDSDATVGSIRDPFAPVVPPSAVPVDAPWALVSLSVMLGLLGVSRQRSRARG